MHALETQFVADWPLDRWQAEGVVIACSGGCDSVGLARLLLATQPRRSLLFLAHYHHGLRPSEADHDEQFVRQLSATWGVSYHVDHALPGDLDAHIGGEGLESAARQLRYQFLLRTACKVGARYLVTAHTADDQEETVLHHILRGTSWSGLAGIPRVRVAHEAVTIVRPMLNLRRAQIEAYLTDIQQPWCHDAQNDERRFLRNRLRGELLPLLEREYHPAARQSLRQLASLATETHAFLMEQAEKLLAAAEQARPGPGCVLDRAPLCGQPDVVVREMFVVIWKREQWPRQQMTRQHWQCLADFAKHGASPASTASPIVRTLPGNIRVEHAAELLRVARET